MNMKFSTIALLMLFTVFVLNPADTCVKVVEAGYGCPGNAYECNEHCEKALGRKGGYCGGPWWLGHPVCTCIQN